MKNLKRLGVAVTLMFVLAVTVFAGETSTPPCANPGEVNAPPCAAARRTELSVSDVALSLIQSLLSLF
jgi:hypothetical protein